MCFRKLTLEFQPQTYMNQILKSYNI